MAAPLALRILGSSVRIANRSGDLIRKILKSGDLGVIDKGGMNNVQTEADRSAQRFIVASLRSQYPGVAVIGEEDDLGDDTEGVETLETSEDKEVMQMDCPEQYKQTDESELVVWVDPLDGTKEFTQGLLDHVTVLIGLAYQGKPIGGVIHQPYYNYQKGNPDELGRTIWGMVGLGAFGFTKNTPAEGNIIATTRSHSNATVNAAIEACKPTEVVRVGGAGHKVLLVLEGAVHSYIMASPGCKKWDTCAPEAVLTAAGGKLTDVHGEHLRYHATVQHMNSAGNIATLSADHDWYVKAMPASVREALKG